MKIYDIMLEANKKDIKSAVKQFVFAHPRIHTDSFSRKDAQKGINAAIGKMDNDQIDKIVGLMNQQASAWNSDPSAEENGELAKLVGTTVSRLKGGDSTATVPSADPDFDLATERAAAEKLQQNGEDMWRAEKESSNSSNTGKGGNTVYNNGLLMDFKGKARLRALDYIEKPTKDRYNDLLKPIKQIAKLSNIIGNVSDGAFGKQIAPILVGVKNGSEILQMALSYKGSDTGTSVENPHTSWSRGDVDRDIQQTGQKGQGQLRGKDAETRYRDMDKQTGYGTGNQAIEGVIIDQFDKDGTPNADGDYGVLDTALGQLEGPVRPFYIAAKQGGFNPKGVVAAALNVIELPSESNGNLGKFSNVTAAQEGGTGQSISVPYGSQEVTTSDTAKATGSFVPRKYKKKGSTKSNKEHNASEARNMPSGKVQLEQYMRDMGD